jgi:hypothetical protein
VYATGVANEETATGTPHDAQFAEAFGAVPATIAIAASVNKVSLCWAIMLNSLNLTKEATSFGLTMRFAERNNPQHKIRKMVRNTCWANSAVWTSLTGSGTR